MKIYGVLNDWDCHELFYKTLKAAREAAERIRRKMSKEHPRKETVVLDFTKKGASDIEGDLCCVSIFEHTVREK